MKRAQLFTPVFLLLFSLLSQPTWARRRRGERPRARAYLVASLDGRRVFAQKHADTVRAIASLTKIMATLVVVESGLKLDRKTKMIPHDWVVAKGGSRTRLRRNKSYTNRDLLHAALLGSDNRAIPALGRAVGYNVHSLVKAMNRRAKGMGLKKTLFKDPTGICYENVSTAREILIMLRAASRNTILSKIMRKESYTAQECETKRKIVYNNTNILTRKRRRKILAGKTGFNKKAGYCLATAMDRGVAGRVAFIILGSTGMLRRFSDYHVLNRKFNAKVAKLKKSGAFKKTARKGRSLSRRRARWARRKKGAKSRRYRKHNSRLHASRRGSARRSRRRKIAAHRKKRVRIRAAR